MRLKVQRFGVVKGLSVATVLLGSLSARAECEVEARKAFEAVRNLPALAFELDGNRAPSAVTFDSGFICGVVDFQSGTEEQFTCNGKQGTAPHSYFSEGKFWTKDSFGWRAPHTIQKMNRRWSLNLEIFKTLEAGSDYACFAQEEADGRTIRRYQRFANGGLSGRQRERQTLAVDIATGIPLRLELGEPGQRDYGKIRYSVSQRLPEKPELKIQDRQRLSEAAFAESRQSSDAACLRRLTEAIAKSWSVPFRFKTKIVAHIHMDEPRGVFVPPHSFNVVSGSTLIVGEGDSVWTSNTRRAFSIGGPNIDTGHIFKKTTRASAALAYLGDYLLTPKTLIGKVTCKANDIIFEKYENGPDRFSSKDVHNYDGEYRLTDPTVRVIVDQQQRIVTVSQGNSPAWTHTETRSYAPPFELRRAE